MSDKSDKLRFTLQFDKIDERHRRAAEYLNRFGRKKSEVVVRALLPYMESNKESDVSLKPILPEKAMSKSNLGKMIKEILEEEKVIGNNVPQKTELAEKQQAQSAEIEVTNEKVQDSLPASEPDTEAEHGGKNPDDIENMLMQSLNMFNNQDNT